MQEVTGPAAAHQKRAPFIGLCNHVRNQLQQVGDYLKATKEGTSFSEAAESEGADRGEMIANLTLAYRHLEDARMRLGKAIQAAEGGVSVFDKPKVREAIENERT